MPAAISAPFASKTLACTVGATVRFDLVISRRVVLLTFVMGGWGGGGMAAVAVAISDVWQATTATLAAGQSVTRAHSARTAVRACSTHTVTQDAPTTTDPPRSLSPRS